MFLYKEETDILCVDNFKSFLEFLIYELNLSDFVFEILKTFSKISFYVYLKSNLTDLMNTLSNEKITKNYGHDYIEQIVII